MCKKSCFRGPFDKQYGKRFQAMLESASYHLYHIHWSLARDFCSKKSLLLACQIMGLLLNTFPTDEKYPTLNRDNLTVPIMMQLSQKEKSFSRFFSPFLKFRLIFECFERKDDTHSFCISEIADSENVVRKLSEKSRLRQPFDKHHGELPQALLESELEHLYHIH